MHHHRQAADLRFRVGRSGAHQSRDGRDPAWRPARKQQRHARAPNRRAPRPVVPGQRRRPRADRRRLPGRPRRDRRWPCTFSACVRAPASRSNAYQYSARETAPGAYYEPPAFDGVVPAPLRQPARWANSHDFSMRTLAYHEGIPGHHFQIGVSRAWKGRCSASCCRSPHLPKLGAVCRAARVRDGLPAHAARQPRPLTGRDVPRRASGGHFTGMRDQRSTRDGDRLPD
ncbi:MAG: DUF885 family protein [Xanthomonadales bacterium]|nr:DUF885 family protein [Xanthomonadales bacterium]